MWVLCPTGWLEDQRDICLWLDSVSSVLKWWVHLSNYLQLFRGKRDTFISSSFFFFLEGLGGGRDENQSTVGSYQNGICLCVWNLMGHDRKAKQDYHYILRTKISEKPVSSFWQLNRQIQREKWDSNSICLQTLTSIWNGFVVCLSAGNELYRKIPVWIENCSLYVQKCDPFNITALLKGIRFMFCISPNGVFPYGSNFLIFPFFRLFQPKQVKFSDVQVFHSHIWF
jgi:hypothetical protein